MEWRFDSEYRMVILRSFGLPLSRRRHENCEFIAYGGSRGEAWAIIRYNRALNAGPELVYVATSPGQEAARRYGLRFNSVLSYYNISGTVEVPVVGYNEELWNLLYPAPEGVEEEAESLTYEI